MIMRLFLLSLGIVLAGAGFLPTGSDFLMAPSWTHPLGTDEFGRDLVRVTVAASGVTLLKAVFLTCLSLSFSLAIAFAVRLTGPTVGTALLQPAIHVIESCPVVLWVFIAIVVLFNAPELFAVTLAFLIAIVPAVSAVISGEYDRQTKLDYVEAARVVGVPEGTIFLRYVMPNTLAVLAPVIVNVFATAMMIDGAIGLIGMGSRSQLDLGVLIIRAKETFLLAPWIAASVILAFVYIFWGLFLVRRGFDRTERVDLLSDYRSI